jgi:hypothetical protein
MTKHLSTCGGQAAAYNMFGIIKKKPEVDAYNTTC